MDENFIACKRESAERLKMLRKSLEYSQERFAELLDISTSAYKKIESGENNVTVGELRILNRELGISADYILYGERQETETLWLAMQNYPDDVKLEAMIRLILYFGYGKSIDFSAMKGKIDIGSIFQQLRSNEKKHLPYNNND